MVRRGNHRGVLGQAVATVRAGGARAGAETHGVKGRRQATRHGSTVRIAGQNNGESNPAGVGAIGTTVPTGSSKARGSKGQREGKGKARGQGGNQPPARQRRVRVPGRVQTTHHEAGKVPSNTG